MKFLPLFELRVRHAFYSDGRCADFAIEPTLETQRLLRNHRSITRRLPDGLRVITAVTDAGNVFIPFSKGAKFAFEMRLENAEFPLFTHLGEVGAQAAPLYTNAALPAPDALELGLRSAEAWFKETLAVSDPSASERFVLGGRPIAGLVAGDFQVESAGSIQRVAGYDENNKLISVDSRSALQGQAFTVTYRLQPVMGRGVWARIEIHANDTLPKLQAPSEPPREFRVSFRAKRARWAYYCVTDLGNAVTAFSIVDTSSSGEVLPLGFSESNRTDLGTHPDPSDPVPGELAERHPKLRRFRFLSDEPIACQQAARKGLEFHLDGSRLPGPLPNPAFRDYSTIRVKIGGAMEEQDSLFAIVKVLTNTGV